MQAFWRESVGEPWEPVEGATVGPDDRENGRHVLRAKIHHFSQFCFGKKLNLLSGHQYEEVSRGRPGPRELEFLNGTDKRILFLVLPTGFADTRITSLTAAVTGGPVSVGGSVERGVISVITSAATGCSVVPVPARLDGGVTSPGGKETCPHGRCNVLPMMMKGVRVVVCTVTNDKVLMWLSLLLFPRTKLIILPALFDDCDGYYASSDLAGQQSNVVVAAGMANITAPVSSITSRGGAVDGSAAEIAVVVSDGGE